MFNDPNTALMALIILNFAGTLLMFLFVLRSQDSTRKVLQEQYSLMQVRLVEMEQRLEDLGRSSGKADAAPFFGKEDDLAAMLDGYVAGERAQGAGRPEVPAPPFAARPPAVPARNDSPLPDLLSLDPVAEGKKTPPQQRNTPSPLDIKIG